ncbi:MAG: hypothetical protein H7123_01465 [Thermoleophilia bacterium]|nr:hypothetical protein [Thermoleophilia bacterium]
MNGPDTQMTDHEHDVDKLEGDSHDGVAHAGEANGEEAQGVDAPLGDLDDHGSVELGVSPEIAVADSLNRALKQLRDDADQIEQMPLDGARIDAAEKLAEDAAALDEEIGSIARSDES